MTLRHPPQRRRPSRSATSTAPTSTSATAAAEMEMEMAWVAARPGTDREQVPRRRLRRCRRRRDELDHLQRAVGSSACPTPLEVHPPGSQRPRVYVVGASPADCVPTGAGDGPHAPSRICLVSNLPPRHSGPPRGPQSPIRDDLHGVTRWGWGSRYPRPHGAPRAAAGRACRGGAASSDLRGSSPGSSAPDR